MRKLTDLLYPPLLAAATAAALGAQDATEPAAMESYEVDVPGTEATITMLPVPVGTEGYPESFRMGSPEDEPGRREDEGPTVEVRVEPFWMAQCEITWDVFDAFRAEYAAQDGAGIDHASADSAQWADAVSLPTPLYEQDSAPILEGLGTTGGYPVANITQLAARQFTKWLSKRTGHFYRLPTEAEWEYAARAGTETPWFFGDDPDELPEYAIYFDNSLYDDPDKGHPDFGAGYRKVGSLAPNPWGFHDVYGNVAEWVIDGWRADHYAALRGEVVAWKDAVLFPEAVFPCVVRGGSWESEPEDTRSAARLPSDPEWQHRDPQLPRSLWWFTDGFHVGFRIVRPLAVPPVEEMLRFWEHEDDMVRDILERGGKEIRAPIGDAETAQPEGGK